jgi:hypothetical protein
MAEEEKKYVWVMWSYMNARRPSCEKYTLVRKNPGGGVTVKQYSGQRVIKPMTGKKFFFSEEEFLAAYRDWMNKELEFCKRRIEVLEEDLAKPDAGASEQTTSTPDTDIRPKNLKV